MTLMAYFQVAQFLVTTMAAVLLWSTRRAFHGGQTIGAFELRLAALERRMDKGNEKSSKLASIVQAMPDRLRTEFVTSVVAVQMYQESHEDRLKLWAEIRHLRDRLDTLGRK